RGTSLGLLDTQDFRVRMSNELTDRVFLGAHDGTIICLRHRALASPLRNKTPEKLPVKKEEGKKPKEDEKQPKEEEKKPAKPNKKGEKAEKEQKGAAAWPRQPGRSERTWRVWLPAREEAEWRRGGNTPRGWGRG